MNKKIGFIGSGKMAQAMIGGLIDSHLIDKSDIFVSAKSNETLVKIKSLYEVQTLQSNIDLATQVDYLFLAVKPDMYPTIIEEIKDAISNHSVIITIAAGITLEGVEKSFGKE